MNIIKHRTYTLEFDVWEPFTKQSESEMDEFIHLLKTKKLLRSCGNVKLGFVAEERQ